MANATKTLLLVEDDVLLALLTAGTLESFGYRVRVAHRGEDAVRRALEDEAISLVLMDMDLGEGMDGAEAARKILDHRRLPVVFLTSRTERDVVERVRHIPRYGYVLKNSGDFVLRSSVEMAYELFEAQARAARYGAALRQSEARSNAFFEGSQEALLIFDALEENVVRVNDAARKLYRLPPRQETPLLNLWALCPEHQPDGARSSEKGREMISQALQSGVQSFEWTARRWDGELFPCAVLLHTVKGERSRRVQITVKDLSAQKRAEEQLRSDEENFRTFFATVDDLILVGNLQGQIIFTNPAVREKLGFSSEELLAMHILDLHLPENREEAGEILGAMFRGERSFCPLPLRTKAGGAFPVETRIWHGKWSGEDCIFGVCKNLSAELEASQRFERLFRNNPALMALTALPDRTFADVNTAFLNTLGYAREEILGRSSEELGLFVRSDQARRLAEELRTQGRVAHRELQIRRKDGKVLVGLFSGETISNQGKEYFLTVMIDITQMKEAEMRLVEEHQRLESILRGTRAGTWEWNVQSGETVFNERWAEIVGYTLEELSPTTIATWERLGHPDDLKRSGELLRRHFAGEIPFYDCQARMRHKDGHWVWVHDRGQVVNWTEDGRPLKMFGTHMDISTAKEAEEALRAKTEELDRYFTSSLDLLCIADTGGHFIRLNPQWEEVLGYPLRELEGRLFLDFVHPDDLDGTFESLARLESQEQVRSFENRYRCRDGSYRWIEWRSIPQGRLIYAAARDITDRKRVEEALRTHSRMQQILMNIAFTYINLPLEEVENAIQTSLGELARFVDADRAYIFDYDFDEGICSNTYEWCHEGIAPQIEELKAVPLEGIPEWVEVHIKGEALYIPDVAALSPGNVRQILEPQEIKSLLTVPMMHRSECVGFVGFDVVRHFHTFSDDEQRLLMVFSQMLVNIRLRQRAEADLRETNRRLAEETDRANSLAERAEEATRAKGAFLANMSHEIRTPMNAILGLIQLAQRGAVEPRQRDYLKKIDRSSRMLLGILNDILDYSKIDAGRLALEDTAFRLADLLEGLEDLFRPKAEEKGLRFLVERDPALPPVLRGDPLRLQQVLSNLLSNALKFTSQGSVALGALRESVPADAHDRWGVRFSVRDTGIGVDPGVREAIFAPFMQGDTSTTRRFGGTGLGLSISRSLVELMGGALELESSSREGSTFSFVIPLGVVDEQEMEHSEVLPECPSLALQGRRWLLAEDHEVNRQVIREILERLGSTVREAENGRQAVAAVEQESFDGVLMDLQMPEMDGLEASRRIRSLHPHLVIIALTASTLEEDRQACLAAGMNDYLLKPVEPALLEHTLVRWLPAGCFPAEMVPEEPRALVKTEEISREQMAKALDLLEGMAQRMARNDLVDGALRRNLTRALEGSPWLGELGELERCLDAFDYDRGVERSRELARRIAWEIRGEGAPAEERKGNE